MTCRFFASETNFLHDFANFRRKKRRKFSEFFLIIHLDRPKSRPHLEEPDLGWIFAGARRERRFGPIFAGEDPPAAENPRSQRSGRVRGHERHPRSGRDQHGDEQERRQHDSLRNRPDHHGHQVRGRLARARRQHSGPLFAQQRQEHSLYRASHAFEDRQRRHLGCAAAPKHDSRVPQRPGRDDSKTSDGAFICARELAKYSSDGERAAGVLGEGRPGVQGAVQLQHGELGRKIRADHPLASRNAAQHFDSGWQLRSR